MSAVRIYLDHNATTPVLPEVVEAMRPHFADSFGNASSAHAFGRRARQALEDARERIAERLGAHPDEVVFTSGATESNNLAIFCLAGEPPARILASPIEHPCVAEPLQRLAERGFQVEYLSVNQTGIVATDDIGRKFLGDVRLFVLTRVNHETGAIQPVVSGEVPSHMDAAQAVGKIDLSFRDLDVTSIAVSAHKFGGPQGIGALLVRRGAQLRPCVFGGHQQQGRRPGTEPVGLAVGMATALAIACANMVPNLAHVRSLRESLLSRLEILCPPVVENGPRNRDQQSPYVLNISFPGLRADALLAALDLAGVACSTGSACSSGSLLPSPVLRAMGVPDDVLRSAMRFSFAPSTSHAEINEAADRIAGCVARLRGS